MIAIISPARTILPCSLPGAAPIPPAFPEKTALLAALLREYAPWQLESILKTNPLLAVQAWESFQAYNGEADGFPALLAYRGLVFNNIAPQDFSSADLLFAADHLRILSAFYGPLSPCSGIQPYRLEFISRLKVNGNNLYRFWGDLIYQALFAARQPVLNLCSAEYAKTLPPYLQTKDTFITCDFLSRRRGKLQCITTSAKAARGQMARFIIKNRITDPKDTWHFDFDGYTFTPELSSCDRYTFIRQ